MTPFPLAWPEHMPRWKGSRQTGQFRSTLNSAMNNVNDSLRRFATDSGKSISGLIISSNVTLGQNNPSDPGVAVWFEWDGLSVCIPVDRYSKVEANLQAIHHVIEARRTELRHGTLALVRASFTGFTALPAPSGKRKKRGWKDVLEVGREGDLTKADIESVYRSLAKRRHPDAPGGSTEAMAELNAAKAEALREISQ